jgi:ectoine hydroxylase-related dioxygenase (phytanoyl-CoA dioxygenase family)
MNYNFKDHGVEILRGILSPEEIQKAIAAVDDFYSKPGGSRVVNLHASNPDILDIITKPEVHKWVEENCFKNPMVYTTLTFKHGTQQPIHRDSPHFLTWPKNNFIGIWYALEDVTIENGCLRYLVGGHKVEDRCGKALAKMYYPDKTRLDDNEIEYCMNNYQLEVTELCEDAGCNVDYGIMKAGDVIIWHALLPHGGSPIINKDATRKSIVAHCVPEGVRVYNSRYFFDPNFNGDNLPKNPIEVFQHGKWKVQAQPGGFYQKKYI